VAGPSAWRKNNADDESIESSWRGRRFVNQIEKDFYILLLRINQTNDAPRAFRYRLL
jgi:hypothetical protein